MNIPNDIIASNLAITQLIDGAYITDLTVLYLLLSAILFTLILILFKI